MFVRLSKLYSSFLFYVPKASITKILVKQQTLILTRVLAFEHSVQLFYLFSVFEIKSFYFLSKPRRQIDKHQIKISVIHSCFLLFGLSQIYQLDEDAFPIQQTCKSYIILPPTEDYIPNKITLKKAIYSKLCLVNFSKPDVT